MSTEFTAASEIRSNTSSTARYVWSQITRHPWIVVGLMVGAFSNAALASLMPYLIGEAFTTIQQGLGMRRVAELVGILIGSQVIRGGLQLMRNASAEAFAQRTERDVRDELYASLLGKSMTFHASQPVGEIMARVTNDVREMNLMMSPGVNLVIGSAMFVVLPLIASPAIHPALILAPGLFLITYALSLYFYVRSLHHVAQNVRRSFGAMNTRLAETLDGIEVVKGAAQEDQEAGRFNSLVDEVQHWFMRQGQIEARYLPVLLLGLTIVGGFLHAVLLFRAGAINTGDIVNFMGQLSLFGFPTFSSLFAYSRIALGFASAERILNVINTETDLDQNEAGHNAPMQGGLVFEDVDFGYRPDKPVLQDISFEVRPGQTVAIVGQTGSGKTTLTRLVNRIYDVTNGRVLVDGVDVRDWNLEALRSQISIIEQEIFLFSRSIADNIRFGRPEATMEEVVAAAKKAQAHDFIMGFPDGYDTVIGQRGVTLSGGQRQRLAIARAFVVEPRILILDDSTSAIDSATEDRIQKAIW
ncbi:MAG TPA: ABC transporter ATP-binding protein, partial [Aggregatilineales bacterium]|nr:ABC transporter ATP-binding protein [Aggregatilineales bacterium]